MTRCAYQRAYREANREKALESQRWIRDERTKRGYTQRELAQRIGSSQPSIALAVERDGKPGEDGKRLTDFIDCVAWGGTAEFLCKYFSKGRIQTRTWKDKQDQTRKSTELNASTLYFGDSKKLEQAAGNYEARESAFAETDEYEDGELPF